MSAAGNLLVHLKPCPAEVDFLGGVYTVPALDTVEWLRLLSDDLDPWKIFPVLAGQQAIDDIVDALWTDRVSPDEVARVGLEVVSAVADRPWWEALRIIHVAASAWDVVHVNQATGRALAGWLDEVWSNILTHIDPKKRAGFIAEVGAVPKGWEGEVDFNDEERAFLAAMKSVAR